MTAPTELSDMLRALDAVAHRGNLEERAARLLRELARDFDEYAHHGPSCPQPGSKTHGCDCGLDAARARWRLP